ncbi:hypothetical protein ABVK25_001361 [Lepraria finkii]|uniref:Uncharacterized protein n=1 Tax=Lepraria finkii TaxID=1340010 RepID=A0ABR4BLG8_9LECA
MMSSKEDKKKEMMVLKAEPETQKYDHSTNGNELRQSDKVSRSSALSKSTRFASVSSSSASGLEHSPSPINPQGPSYAMQRWLGQVPEEEPWRPDMELQSHGLGKKQVAGSLNNNKGDKDKNDAESKR